MGTTHVRAIVRQGQFYKIPTALETGGAEGCWTFGRYREWLDRRSDWFFPPTSPLGLGRQEAEEAPLAPADSGPPSGALGSRSGAPRLSPAAASASGDSVMAIDDAEEDLDGILSDLDRNEARARRGDRGSDTDSRPPS